MSLKEIRELDQLLSDHLGTEKCIKSVDMKRISEPGENYGSIMYGLDVVVTNKNTNSEEVLHIVAKVLPESELMREVFNIQTTYKNEMAFYKEITRTLVAFQKQLGVSKTVDFFPKCYAVRKNLVKGSEVIDDDAVLLLENLKIAGYKNIDKIKGFDLDTTKMVLRDIAQLNGVPLALKIKNPSLFNKNIKPYCVDYYRTQGEMPTLVPLLKIIMDSDDETKEIGLKTPGWDTAKRPDPREPYSTLVHDDLWTNNTMQKFENGRPVGNKLVDYQIINYNSPAIDLFFYLWSSVPLALLKSNLDYFIRYYYDNLVEILKQHQVDITQFTFESFLDEIHHISPFEFKHALYFHLIAVHGKKGGYDINRHPTAEEVFETVTDVAMEKARYMIKECYKRGWLR